MAVTDAGIAGLSAVELRARYAEGSLSPVEVHEAVQDVIARREPVLNAFWRHDPEGSRAQAKESERRWRDGEPLGPADGIPLTLKENVARAGVPMPAGTAGVEPVVPERDAPITARVLETGGVVLGSTVMPDWGMLSSGVSSLHGTTRSPWNPDLTTGGSSAGAGAAAAAGYGPLHVGTDIGGSIRLPGTWLGLATLKPSNGRIPLDAPYLGRAAGPMARTVGDLALFMEVLSRPDDRDWTSLPPHSIDWTLTDLDPRGLRVGLHLDAGCGGEVDPEILAAVQGVADVFAAAGAEVAEVAPFMTPDLLDSVDLFWRVRSLNDYDALTPEQQSRVLPYIAEWVAGGAGASGVRVLDCYQQIMRMQAVTVEATLPYDIVLSPVAPVSAFPAEQPMPYPDNGRGMQHIGFTVPYNMSGQPAATVNCGFTTDGRTIGVQISGRRFDDPGVLRAAAWYEAHRPASAVPDWPIG
ncbi:amidase [Ornithinicoccus hortensis]|uniref:Aspartyl-tRNA(Asn)/glutamyl-tRNA(Gln) amidotransferase subunit A n=1 Tax=Ornithinicoccus hortensis TaxID=82346 RepID=A0A542YQS9_9MICO|nr:amidase [Ornithinicoccus hortensis]TQL50453.1 aspartyl-tRNA(Asn)/glutamyl-tRNA(Gln) amidotransferase subunit A [Ornithinicoccus hortensis]